jgi:hypothetical protein
MNDAESTSDDTSRSLTLDCVDFWLDGPGDHTVRPIPPERLVHAKAEWAKILAAQTLQNKTSPLDA